MLRTRALGQIGQPLADRGRLAVDDVEHALCLLLHRQDGNARSVVDVHPGEVAGAAPDERKQPLRTNLT